MHPNCMRLMTDMKTDHFTNAKGARILDVGSQDVNGSFRSLFSDCGSYVGLDIQPGKDVDVVCEKEDAFPFKDNEFDYVISGNCLEHCKHPWNTVKEIARVLKPEGLTAMIAPWSFHIHKDDSGCPTDCFRILPDGFSSMIFDAGLELLKVGTDDTDCFALAKKPKEKS